MSSPNHVFVTVQSRAQTIRFEVLDICWDILTQSVRNEIYRLKQLLYKLPTHKNKLKWTKAPSSSVSVWLLLFPVVLYERLSRESLRQITVYTVHDSANGWVHHTPAIADLASMATTRTNTNFCWFNQIMAWKAR